MTVSDFLESVVAAPGLLKLPVMVSLPSSRVEVKMAAAQNRAASQLSGRISLIDIARGVALVAMTIYHFTWDLEFFHWAPPATTLQTGWVLFARGIASSFLFLVGVSLFLAHRDGIRWPGFWKRFALVAGAAALISVATYIATPNAFIFFGILHAIALFSVLGLPFVFLPWWVVVLAASGVWFGDALLANEIFNTPALWWVGLSPVNPNSNDYVPLFPWFCAPLLGIAAAKLAAKFGWFARAKGVAENSIADKTLGLIGRHSLLYYMVHQPLMIGLVWLFTQVTGPPDPTPAFLHNCTQACVRANDAAFCKKFCACTAQGLKTGNLFTPYLKGKVDLSTNPAAQNVINQCSIE